MANLLTNAGFLELATGWTKSAILTLAADEATRGAPGRAALVGSGTTTSASQQATISTATAQRAAVTAGQSVEASVFAAALMNGAVAAPTVRLLFYNAGGTQTGAVTLTPAAAPLSAYGEGLRGASATYRRAWGRATAPASTVSAGLEVGVTGGASGSALVLAMLKPLIAVPPTGRVDPLVWDPGLHTDPDFAGVGAWPDLLKPFQSGPGAEPLAGRVEFQAGAGRPAARRNALDPARRFSGVLRCDPVQRAALETFWREGAADFWFVEPGSERLCIASWAADGQPRAVESRGPTVMMECGLWLETA